MKTLKLTSLTASLAIVASLGGCTMKQKILDAGAVSMTHSALQPGDTLREKGPVTGTWCYSSSDSGTVGMMDETVRNAQKENNVDYITNAAFFVGPKPGCMMVEGTGNMIVSTSSAVTQPSSPEAPIKAKPATKRR